MTKKFESVEEAIEFLEYDGYYSTGVSYISGGFSNVLIRFEDDYFYHIDLTWGIQSDCEDVVNKERYIYNKLTGELLSD